LILAARRLAGVVSVMSSHRCSSPTECGHKDTMQGCRGAEQRRFQAVFRPLKPRGGVFSDTAGKGVTPAAGHGPALDARRSGAFAVPHGWVAGGEGNPVR